MNDNIKNRERQLHSELTPAVGQYRPLFHKGITCPNCKKIVDKEFELCPNCGYRLHSTHCTYCGAPMSSEDLFCGECGGSVKGTPCPSCGTLSFRSFCPKCNHAVDKLGEEELKKAKEDPLYQRICALAERIAATQDMYEAQSTPVNPEIAELLEKYRSLSVSLGKESTHMETKASEENAGGLESESETSGIKLTDSGSQLLEMSSAIKELNTLMQSMYPDPGLTPQMQRNYYSARKVAVVRKSIVKERVGWVCNLCGCCHNAPSGCARPELGGTWVYKEKEITTKTYE